MLQYEIALTMLPGIGDITGKKLVACCGSVEGVFQQSRKELLKHHLLGEFVIKKLLSGRDEALRRSEHEITFIEKYNISPLFFLDKKYPYRLGNCVDGPVLLYYKGNADLNSRRIVGVVGTRKATDYGRELCLRLIEGLADAGVLIVSGLAFGIDSCAHKNALQYEIPTVGVLGHGLDRLYPVQNKALAERMIHKGGLLTDFPSKTQPDRENFPKRNRIIAGLCDALVVVEAAEKGGALITAEIANSYDREVFAVPGRIGDEYSKGCNNFIKTNRAALVETAEDIKYLMGWNTDSSRKQVQQQELFVEFTDQEEAIFTILRSSGNSGIDFLVTESGMTSSNVAKALLNLEFKGAVRCLPGKRYQVV